MSKGYCWQVILNVRIGFLVALAQHSVESLHKALNYSITAGVATAGANVIDT